MDEERAERKLCFAGDGADSGFQLEGRTLIKILIVEMQKL